MSLISKTVALEKGLRAEFIRRAISAAPVALVNEIAMVVESDSNEETYAWFGEVAQMEELKDQRKYRGFSDTKFTIVNKEWAGGIRVRRKEVKDDKVNVILNRVRSLADRARKFPLKLVFDQLNDLENAVGYDGVAFYHNAHPIRGQQSATQDNLLTGTGTTVAALKTDISEAIKTMAMFKDEGDEPFHEIIDPKDLRIVCGPGLKANMIEVLNATIIANTTNTLPGQVGGLIVNPRYSDTDDWDLLHVGDFVKPIVLQEREPLEFEAMEDGSGDDAFDRKVWKYGTYMRANTGPGMWQYGVRTKN